MTSPHEPAELLTAALADHYRLERELGAGGMATVYLARDLRHDRDVAIKVLRPELAAVIGAERFLREIRTIATLQHPHILGLIDSGEIHGTAYYVMPFVDGESLRDRLHREKQLPIGDAIRLATEVADALNYAHRRGVIHRDIKPENILLHDGRALVADFGIALAVSDADAGTRMTETGMSLGTPHYMSPEQAMGEREITPRSDVYALGAMTYEMLVGEPPFTGSTAQAIVAKVMTEKPAPPSRARDTVPEGVETAVLTALQKLPADRFASAAEFAAALRDGGQVDGRTVSRAATKSGPEGRFPARLATLVAVAALAVAAWLILGSRRPTEVERSIAVLPFELVGTDSTATAFVLGVHGELVTQLSRIESLSVASRAASSAYREHARPARDIANELGVTTLLTGNVQRAGGRIRLQISLDDAARGRQLWGETYDRELTAENLFAIQGDVAGQVATALRVQLSDGQTAELSRPATRNLAALDLYHGALQGWYNRQFGDSIVVTTLERAVALDPTFSRAWGLLAQWHSWRIRTGAEFDTLPAWRAVQRTRTVAPGSLEAMLAAGYYHYYAQGDYQRALDELEAARRILPASAELVSATGLLQRRLGRYDEALAAFQKAAALDPHDVEPWWHLVDEHLSFGRHAEASRALDRALARWPSDAILRGRRVHVLLNGSGDTAQARAAVAESRPLIAQYAADGFDIQLAVIGRDWAALESLLEGGSQFQAQEGFPSSGFHRRLVLALARHLDRRQAEARSAADSTVRTATAFMEQRPNDAFGLRSLALIQASAARAILGDSARAVQDVERALAAFNRSVDGADGHFMHQFAAMTYLLVGRHDDAIEQLRLGMTGRMAVTPARLRLDPWWDPLRGDQRFEALAAAQ